MFWFILIFLLHGFNSPSSFFLKTWSSCTAFVVGRSLLSIGSFTYVFGSIGRPSISIVIGLLSNRWMDWVLLRARLVTQSCSESSLTPSLLLLRNVLLKFGNMLEIRGRCLRSVSTSTISWKQKFLGRRWKVLHPQCSTSVEVIQTCP